MAARHDSPPTPLTIRPNFDRIPTELQRLNQWVLWRWERRAGKFTKPPFTRGGHHAQSNDPRTWTDFDGVRIAYGGLNFSGVGLCLSADDGLTGIDLDHVVDRETGAIVKPEAAEIVERFAGTYTEKSPSGDGLRIWCYGKAPRSGKAPGYKWCEVYTHPSHRYLTVTGAQWPGSADVVSDQQEGLDWLHATFMKKPDRKAGIAPPASPAPVPCDQELLELIRQSKQGAAFDRLYGGDAGADHSSADLALCNMLAFWCGRDPEQMDRLFRRSGLMRQKWEKRHSSDGRTYGQITVHKAIEDCREVYKPRGTSNAYALRPKTDEGDPGIPSGAVESKAYATVADLDDARARKVFESQIETTDDFDELLKIARSVNASGLGEAHREKLDRLIRKKAGISAEAVRGLGVAETASPAGGGMAGVDTEEWSHHQFAEAWIRARRRPGPVCADGHLYEYDKPAGLWAPVPRHLVELELGERWNATRCSTKAHYRGIADHIEDCVRDVDFFDLAPVGVMTPGGFYEATPEGVVRRAASPDFRQRFAVGATPEERPTPLFDAFLDRAFADDDPERTIEQQLLLQEVVGAALVGVLYRYERAVYLHGRERAGKSTLLRLVEAMLPRSMLGSVSPYSWDTDYGRAALAGLRVNIVGELPRDVPIPASDFKAVLGRDRIQARLPYGRPFSFRPVAAHFFNSNHWICTRDQHPAFFDRWLILSFQNTVPPEDRDLGLDKKIVDSELAGVLHWALQGASRVVSRGRFTPSRAHTESLEAWRCSSDSVAAFMLDRTRRDSSLPGIRRGDLFDAYLTYCADEDRKPVGKKSFFERVQSLGHAIGQNAAGDRLVRHILLR